MTAKFFIITLILTYLTKKSSSWTITPSKNLITPAQLANRLDTSLRMSDTKEEAAKGPQIGEDGMVGKKHGGRVHNGNHRWRCGAGGEHHYPSREGRN
jgi:hypothetical protein